jgi:uncharacterized protein
MKAPPAFLVMAKPHGAICNLDCAYCFYLSKEMLYADTDFRMTNEILEEYTQRYIAAQRVPTVTFVWQGGEPTLMGLDFFRLAVDLQEKYCQPGMQIGNALQTNGTTLDDEWCRFFKAHDFLIGLSLDGPRELHDFYRMDKGGNPTFDRVMAGLELLKMHSVEFNILTCVSAANAEHSLEVYRFLRDEVGAQFLQFIPIVERDDASGEHGEESVTYRSVTGRQYGDFLKSVFDEWVRHDIGKVNVQILDTVMGTFLGAPGGLCVFAETCGAGLAIEHNGDLYSCDHYVNPEYKLGNIVDVPLIELVGSEQQRLFGFAKRETLPRYCQECEVRAMCNGGCPKNRILHTPDGEPALNYLCEGYRAFFNHITPAMTFMAAEMKAGRSPTNIIYHLAREEAVLKKKLVGANRNDPCPCGSGQKFKRCHGRRH